MNEPPIPPVEGPPMDDVTRLANVEGHIRVLTEAVGQQMNEAQQTREHLRAMVEESMTQVLNRFPGLMAGDQPPDPVLPGPSLNIPPNESDGQTQGSDPSHMHLDGTPSDGNPSSSFAAPAISTRNVHISNIQDARGRIERIPDYKGERKNDVAAIWLMRADNSIAEQEELTQSRFTDRQKIAHASRALRGEADAWYQLNQTQARRNGDHWFAETWPQFHALVAERFKDVRTDDERRDEFDNLRQEKTVQDFYHTKF